MGGKSSSSTFGYRYFMGLHFSICYGPVDALKKILVGDRAAWDAEVNGGEVTFSRPIQVSNPNLFGGDEREGGVVGVADIMMGEPTQEANAYLQEKAGNGNPIPAYRGVFSVVFRGDQKLPPQQIGNDGIGVFDSLFPTNTGGQSSGQVSANNPYIKPWAFQIRRIKKGWNGAGIDGSGNFIFPWLRLSDPRNALNQHEYRGYVHPTGLIGTGWSDDLDALVEQLTTTGGYDFPDPTYIGYAYQAGSVWKFIPEGEDAIDADVEDVSTVYFIYAPERPDQGTVDLLEIPGGSFLCKELIDQVGLSEIGQSVWFSGRLAGQTATAPFGRLDAIFDATAGADPGWYNTDGCPGIEFDEADNPNVYYRSDGTNSVMIIAVRRKDQASDIGGDCWYPEKAQIGDDMNPAHIIYQCVTDPAWGEGYPAAQIDDANFRAIADALYDEGFGLSFMWARQEEIGRFISIVLDHIGGAHYTNPRTGKFSLKLIRDDYDVDSLPLFDESNMVALESFQRVGYGETINEITLVYTERETGKDASVTVQDLANIQAQGAVVNQTINLPGIPTADLALRVAQRELLAVSTPLAKLRIQINRSAWDLIPGDAVKVSWAKLGLVNVVCRILAINIGTAENGIITLDLVEDVFGLPDSTYAAQEPIGWEDQETTPQDITLEAITEAPYWHVARSLTAPDLQQLDDDSAFVISLAGKPFGIPISYRLWSKTDTQEDFQPRAGGAYAPTATLVDGIDRLTTKITYENGSGPIGGVGNGSLAILGEGPDAEWVTVKILNTFTKVATIARGILDTTPKEHAAGTRIWFASDAYLGRDKTERATGEEIDVRLTNLATGGESLLVDATEMSLTMSQRFGRPYPPGRLRINDQVYPASVFGDPITITWAHRNRLQQTAFLVEQDEGNIGPEPGTTYNVRLYDADTDTLLEEFNGINGTSFTSTIAGFYNIRAELESVRDGIRSWHSQTAEFAFADGVRITEDGDFRITEDGDYRVVVRTNVNYTHQIEVVFSGSLDSAEIIYVNVNNSIYTIPVAGKTDLSEIAEAIADAISADGPYQVIAFAEGSKVVILSATQLQVFSVYNNTAKLAITQTVQEPHAVSAGVRQSSFIDYYTLLGALSPDYDSSFAETGSGLFRMTIQGATYALRKTLPSVTLNVSFTDLGTTTFYLPNLPDPAVLNADTGLNLASYGLSCTLFHITSPPIMQRAALVFDATGDYRIVGVSDAGNPSDFVLRSRVVTEGSPAYPSGAKQMDTVIYVLDTVLVSGQKFRVVLDGVTYEYTITVGDAAVGGIGPVYSGLKSLIEAGGLFTVTLYGTTIEIERNTANVPFTSSASASYGVIASVTFVS